MDKLIQYYEENKKRFLDDLVEFCKYDSVSSDPERKDRLVECGQWLVDHLKKIGIAKVEMVQTAGHPIVYAEHPGPEGAPTALIYGHYDVQPEDPIDLWDTPPFEPTERDGLLFGRGTVDDKGQLMTHVNALEAYLKVRGELPVGVKLVFEGEEEVGSENLSTFLHENAAKLGCDVVVVSDTSMFARDLPTITYALRGLTYFEIGVQASKGDLHSGSYGGAVANPGNELAKIIASMKDDDHRITIPGFYDDVLELTVEEREQFAKLPHSDEEYRAALDAPALVGEKGFTTVERKWARPTLDVNGMWSGFMGEGAKTVLPAKAGAKISMRLVPHQDPEKIEKAFAEHVMNVAGEGVTVKVEPVHSGRAFLCPLDDPMLKAAACALEKGFGKCPVYTREGGSIPIVTEFQETLKAPILLLGLGAPGENAHAPNENFVLDHFYNGIKSWIYLWDEVTKK
jgi:acetylornithine deacetylase/succinyl-diaminopimelate desuccinylase-like protein